MVFTIVGYAVCSMRCIVCGVRCNVFGVRCALYYVRSAVCGVMSNECGVRRVLRCMIYTVCRIVYTPYMVFIICRLRLSPLLLYLVELVLSNTPRAWCISCTRCRCYISYHMLLHKKVLVS